MVRNVCGLPNESDTLVSTDNEFQLAWVWGLLGIALAILAIAIVSLRHRWNHRGDAATSPTPLPTA